MPTLLAINPNTTESVTQLVHERLRAVLPDAVAIRTVTGRFGARYISSEAAFAIASHAALDAWAEAGDGADAVLIACFGDPGLFALKEIASVPVTGLLEASLSEATQSVKRVAIVTGGMRWPAMLRRLSEDLGYADALADIVAVELTGAQIASDPAQALPTLAEACERAARHADCVILGGAGLAGLASRLQPACSVPLVDSVEAGARWALNVFQATKPAATPGQPRSESTGLSPALAAKLSQ